MAEQIETNEAIDPNIVLQEDLVEAQDVADSLGIKEIKGIKTLGDKEFSKIITSLGLLNKYLTVNKIKSYPPSIEIKRKNSSTPINERNKIIINDFSRKTSAIDGEISTPNEDVILVIKSFKNLQEVIKEAKKLLTIEEKNYIKLLSGKELKTNKNIKEIGSLFYKNIKEKNIYISVPVDGLRYKVDKKINTIIIGNYRFYIDKNQLYIVNTIKLNNNNGTSTFNIKTPITKDQFYTILTTKNTKYDTSKKESTVTRVTIPLEPNAQ